MIIVYFRFNKSRQYYKALYYNQFMKSKWHKIVLAFGLIANYKI